MSNLATALKPLSIRVGNQPSVTPILITFDTTGMDLTVFTPDPDTMCAVVGLAFSCSNASNLVIKSASNTLVSLQLAANQGIMKPIGEPLFVTGIGESLIMQCSVVIPTILAYVVQADNFSFAGE